MDKVTVKDILNRKQKERRKITALTAYDFPFARLVDEAGIDIVLVGDSVGMVCLGYESTLPVTMRQMLHHVKAVSRAVKWLKHNWTGKTLNHRGRSCGVRNLHLRLFQAFQKGDEVREVLQRQRGLQSCGHD